jgi:hypothetical protein
MRGDGLRRDWEAHPHRADDSIFWMRWFGWGEAERAKVLSFALETSSESRRNGQEKRPFLRGGRLGENTPKLPFCFCK